MQILQSIYKGATKCYAVARQAFLNLKYPTLDEEKEYEDAIAYFQSLKTPEVERDEFGPIVKVDKQKMNELYFARREKIEYRPGE